MVLEATATDDHGITLEFPTNTLWRAESGKRTHVGNPPNEVFKWVDGARQCSVDIGIELEKQMEIETLLPEWV